VFVGCDVLVGRLVGVLVGIGVFVFVGIDVLVRMGVAVFCVPMEGFVPQSTCAFMQFVTSVCKTAGSQALKKS